MKNKLFILVIMITVLLMSTVSANEPLMKTITGTLSDAKFMLNGKEVILQDKTNKRQLKAIYYENRLYVPVESVIDLLKLPMTYNAEIDTFEIGKKSGLGDDLVDIKETSSNDIRYFIKTIDEDLLTINEGNNNEQSFGSGLVLLEPVKGRTYSRTFDLNSEYTELSFKSIIDSKTTKKDNLIVTFTDVDKKRVVKVVCGGDDRRLQEYSIKVTGVNRLQISIEVGDKVITKYIMGDIFLK